MAKTALVPIADGSEEIEAMSIIDVLRRAGVEVTVASVEKNIVCTLSRKVKVEADTLFADISTKDFDIIVLPGGMPGAATLGKCEGLITMLKKQNEKGKMYAAICAAPAVVLEAHGLLKDKKATCYPAFKEKMTQYADDVVCVSGNCVTSQGPATALKFAIKLVELLVSSDEAKKQESALLMSA